MAEHSVIDSNRTGRGEATPFPSPGRGDQSRGGAGARSRRAPGGLPSTQRRVRTHELALGILLAAGCGLGAVIWTASVSSTTPALVLAHDVKRGDVLGLDDFAPAEARATGLRLVTYADRDEYVGRIAAIDMPAATALSDSVALELAPIADGEALVGLRIEAGEFPTGLRSGSTVRIVGVGEPTAIAELATTKIVVETIEPLEGAVDQVVVTVRIPAELGVAVAQATDVRLIEVPA